jgi:outer membrane receptor protein involved in Fe transport
LLNPQPVTSNIKQFAYLPSLKEQHTFSSGALAEFALAWLAINSHERPLGDLPFVVRPEGNSGNFFRTSDAETRRLQGLFNLYLPSFEGLGRHEVKVGLDLDHITYDQSVNRRAISVLREDGTLSEQVTFLGPQNFGKNNFESGAYIQDRWSFAEHWLVEAGLRLDRDSIIRSVAVDPRLAVTFSPTDKTKFSGGIGLFYDETNLELITRPLQGPRVEQLFAADGSTVTSVRQVVFNADSADLKPPRSLNWSLGFEQKLLGQNYFRADFIQRRGRNGLAYLNEAIATAPVIPLMLRSVRQDHYDAVQISARHNFKAGNVLFVSYVRSSARSDPVLDFTVDQIFDPLFTQQNSGPLPWDAPNNVLSYGWLPLPKSFQFSYTFQWRTGFPFSLVNQQQQIVGDPNSHRFPDFFNLGAYLEKRFPLFGLNWAVRGGFDNITGHQNPTVVNNNVDSPQFLQFSQSPGRSFTARIRFLGRK